MIGIAIFLTSVFFGFSLVFCVWLIVLATFKRSRSYPEKPISCGCSHCGSHGHNFEPEIEASIIHHIAFEPEPYGDMGWLRYEFSCGCKVAFPDSSYSSSCFWIGENCTKHGGYCNWKAMHELTTEARRRAKSRQAVES